MKPFIAMLSRLAVNALRPVAFGVGAWLTALLPVDIWIDQRNAANLASGHMPNMAPETVMFLAVGLATPVLVGLLVIEVVRTWVLEFKPLSLPASVVLAAVACWPVGASLTISSLSSGYPGVFIASGVSVIGFYGIRHVAFARRRSQVVIVR